MGAPIPRTLKECAFIGGRAATPKIEEGQKPEEHPQSCVGDRTKAVRKAAQHVANTLGYNIEEATNVAPEEYALGGFGGRGAQKTLSRMVKKHKTDAIRAGGENGWTEPTRTKPQALRTGSRRPQRHRKQR